MPFLSPRLRFTKSSRVALAIRPPQLGPAASSLFATGTARMWCEKCKSDVAAMASPDNERLYCTGCSSELTRPVSAAAIDDASVAVRKTLPDPRELLARWAREDALGGLNVGSRTPAEKPPEPRPQLRFDSSHAAPQPQAPVVDRIARGPAQTVSTARELPELPGRDLVIHTPHSINSPHFQPAVAPSAPADRSSKWVTLVGQIFAYIGVGGLTIGTVLVLVGYFGGPANYATTGWLVTTAGQMLLFLGVITLISGGMEQTTQEVARRIDTLGERLQRIEQATQRSKPPGESRPREEASIN